MKKRKDKGRDGMPIVRVLRSVVVAVQGPVCFYLPIKAVLRVGVLLVVALDRQGRMLATSETPRWQGRALQAMCVSNLCSFDPVLPGECSQWSDWMGLRYTT